MELGNAQNINLVQSSQQLIAAGQLLTPASQLLTRINKI